MGGVRPVRRRAYQGRGGASRISSRRWTPPSSRQISGSPTLIFDLPVELGWSGRWAVVKPTRLNQSWPFTGTT
jgi:hypothetical protein